MRTGTPVFLAGLDETAGRRDVVADRFLDDHRYARLDALQTTGHVHPVRRGQDDAVGLVVGEQLGEGRVKRNTVRRANSGPAGPGSTIDASTAESLASISSMCRLPINPAPATANRTWLILAVLHLPSPWIPER